LHRVVKAHLDDFVQRFSLDLSEDRAFESFVAHVVLRAFTADNVPPAELIYDGDDPGIDSVLVFIDDKYISSAEEVQEAFSGKKRDLDATICFLQCKSGEAWQKAQINTFQSAVIDFLGDSPAYPHSDYMRNAAAVFSAVIKNVGKLRGGKPKGVAYFATTGMKPEDREILAAFSALERSAEKTGFFSEFKVEGLDRDRIVSLWNSADGPVEATLPVLAMAAFPKAPDVEEGYVVTAKARDFIEHVLSDATGKLRQRIFEENVRDFIGIDNEVNSEIANTIKDSDRQKRFGILNNGVTIISPDVRVQGNELFLRDFQIVNGCQTSNVLFDQREEVSDSATLMLKIIETDNAKLVDEIVRSTNRQSKVQDEQFLATLDCVKAIEQYFIARGKDETHKLFFERRKNQFANEDVKAIRVFDIKEVARATASMFLNKPDLASRYPNRLTGEMQDTVFKREYVEDIYYTSAFALYRLQLLLSNSRIDPKYGKLRWHILMAARLYLEGDVAVQLNSPKIKKTCVAIDDFFASSEDEQLDALKELCGAIANVNTLDRDQIRSITFVNEVREAAIKFRAKHPPKAKKG
jgi:hypothetical protein